MTLALYSSVPAPAGLLRRQNLSQAVSRSLRTDCCGQSPRWHRKKEAKVADVTLFKRTVGKKKRTTKTTWLVACLYLSWKASGTTKHINGLLWRWIGWTQTQTQIKTSQPRQSLHDLRLHLFLHWPHTFPSHPPKLSRLNPDLWVADSSMAWWPNCLPSCLSICRSLAVVKRNYSYLESCQDLTINSWSFFTLSFNFCVSLCLSCVILFFTNIIQMSFEQIKNIVC